MKAKDIPEHFVSRSAWVDSENTVDRVVIGDPESEHDRCLVAWTPGMDVLEAAVEREIRLIVCHEPIFYNHWDKDPEATPGGARKLAIIQEHALTIVRIHDSWDRWPELGIPWAWGRFLGFSGKPATTAQRDALHRYDIEPTPFGTFAKQVAERTARIRQPVVEVAGDPEKPVSKIGIGTGCFCDIWEYLAMGCDACVLTDDGSSYWKHVQYARDVGVPVLCVNHATAEEPGMVTLAQYVNDSLPGLEAEHIPQGCRYDVAVK